MNTDLWMAAFALLLTSCCAHHELFGPPNRAERQEDAASASVAVLSIAPWQDYRDDVQPVFKLSPEDAVAQAIPSTLSIEERLLSALAASLKVALPTNVASTTTKTHSETGSESKTTTDATTTSSTGNASDIATPGAPAGSASSLTLPGGDASSATAIDPMLRYWAAAALYEEVQLINRYVKDAATGDDVAYVVRLQVSLMPRMRDEPYDAYSLISFFPGAFSQPGEPWRIAAQDSGGDDPGGADGPGGGTKTNRIRILPLLVTDDLEAAVRRRSVEDLRQIAVALSAVAAGTGLTGQISSTSDALRASAGRDFNSTFTVARLAENTLQCRFGAMHQAGVHYAMIPQTHNVTVLLLVPRAIAESAPEAARMLHLVAQTRLIDVENGKPLDNRTEDEVLARADAILLHHGIRSPGSETERGRATLREVLYAIASNQPHRFQKQLEALQGQGGVSYPESVWLDLVSIRAGGDFSSAEFSVPRRVVDAPPDQSPVLVDDGKQTTQVTLRGGTGLDAPHLTATLTLHPGTGATTLVATAVKVVEGGKEITFAFPSLAALKVTDKDGVKGGDPELAIRGEMQPGGKAVAARWKCKYLSGAAEKPGFSMTVRTKALEADAQNRGKVKVAFSETKPTAQILLNVDGADVEAIEPKNAAHVRGDGWKVDADATLTLTLSNLSNISPVTITASDGLSKVKHAPIVIPVTHAQRGARTAP